MWPTWPYGVAASDAAGCADLVHPLSKARSAWTYRQACAVAGKRRLDPAPLHVDGTDHAEIERNWVLPAYVDGADRHWRESAEDDAERELIRRIDAGDTVPATEIGG